jgi:excinuclease ABC subunit A
MSRRSHRTRGNFSIGWTSRRSIAIRGIPPAIAIEQSNPVKTTRSTVGTMTEVNDYLKLFLPRVVTAHCPSCQREIHPETPSAIAGEMLALHGGSDVLVTFSTPVPPGTKPAEFFAFLQQQGYLRVWLSDAIWRTDEPAKAPRLPGLVHVIQDRTRLTDENRLRLSEAVEIALRFGKGKVAFILPEAKSTVPFSTGWHCAHCDIDITPPSAGLFSFNHPQGACPRCRGFGRTIALDLDRAIPDRSLSLAGGVVRPFRTENGKECQRDLMRCAAAREVNTKIPFCELPKADQDWVLFGERAWHLRRGTLAGGSLVRREGDSSIGSRAGRTKCTCACCSAAIARIPRAPIARRPVSTRHAQFPLCRPHSCPS